MDERGWIDQKIEDRKLRARVSGRGCDGRWRWDTVAAVADEEVCLMEVVLLKERAAAVATFRASHVMEKDDDNGSFASSDGFLLGAVVRQ
ncbi:hypothetical protein OsI_36066 [Oryza sativa Indica Group]|uniref:Uncharacterized protein n=2 Tax=Oryza sativa TaxID=4530 RepID=A3CB62_ORYSJ|nr:hypothetical protein OsI_36066 [Oryza sativa Indica Group]EAZ18325.1 hypothetical protein OsJ_33858 [Oryza sativa Japonica Group]